MLTPLGPSNPSNTLLARYLAGECSAKEVDDIVRWSSEDAAHRKQLEELRALWHARPAEPSWDTERMWADVQRVVRVENRQVAFRLLRPWRRESRRWGGAVAAAAAGVLVASGFGLIRYNESKRQDAAESSRAREYVTGRGQRVTLQLPDGSRLTLAPESRLRIPAAFGHVTRDVLLDGEAAFHVVHSATRPFRVRAKHAVVQDLGTRFGVRAYRQDSVVTVAVATGSVALGLAEEPPTGAAQGVVLNSGQLGSLGPAGQVAVASGSDVADALAWTDGNLVFHDLPLGEVVARLNRWYDADVRLASPELAARRVRASFHGESVADALHFVASFLDLTVTQNGNSFVLRAR